MSPNQHIHPAVSIDIYRRLKAYSARRGISLGAIVEAALRQYLDQSGDLALLLGRLDRNGRALERLKRDLELLSEFQSVFVRIWFAHTPQIAESEREAASRLGSKRFEQMLDFVSKRVAGGHRLGEDLVGAGNADVRERAVAAAEGGSDGTRPSAK
jgi:hypothetical protein